MGYWSCMYLVDVKIKDECLKEVKRQIRRLDPDSDLWLLEFLDCAAVDRDGYMRFKADKDGLDPYVPDNRGLIPAKDGKWYGDEVIARWLKPRCEGGALILHSNEADGNAWGWQFDGQGKMRKLELRAVGKWR